MLRGLCTEWEGSHFNGKKECSSSVGLELSANPLKNVILITKLLFTRHYSLLL